MTLISSVVRLRSAECGVRNEPQGSAFARLRRDKSAQYSKGRPSLCECMRVHTSQYERTRGFLLFVSPARSGRVRPNQSKSRQSNRWVRVGRGRWSDRESRSIKADQSGSNPWECGRGMSETQLPGCHTQRSAATRFAVPPAATRAVTAQRAVLISQMAPEGVKK